jgi:hypothetical protein
MMENKGEYSCGWMGGQICCFRELMGNVFRIDNQDTKHSYTLSVGT